MFHCDRKDPAPKGTPALPQIYCYVLCHGMAANIRVMNMNVINLVETQQQRKQYCRAKKTECVVHVNEFRDQCLQVEQVAVSR